MSLFIHLLELVNLTCLLIGILGTLKALASLNKNTRNEFVNFGIYWIFLISIQFLVQFTFLFPKEFSQFLICLQTILYVVLTIPRFQFSKSLHEFLIPYINKSNKPKIE